jgi:formylglycine-generating enzyme required for sulfatase activity
MSRGRVGRADLVTAVGLEDSPDQAAALLGYERVAETRPEPQAEKEPRDRESAPVEQTPSEEPELASRPTAPTDFQLRTWRVVSYQRLQPPAKEPRKILTRPVLPPSDTPPPSIAPLAPAGSLLVRLRRAWQHQAARGVDEDAAVERISRGEILFDLPERSQRKWGRRLEVIADRSERLVPFWADQDAAARALLPLFPSGSVTLHTVSEIDDRAISAFDPSDDRTDAHLLVLGDLGALERRTQGATEPWLTFGQHVRRTGGRPLALIPCPAAYLSQELRDVWDVIPWEPNHVREDQPEDDRQLGPLQLLQTLLAPAVRLEPGLLRAVRRILPHGSLDPALESFFWQDDALIGTSQVAATWQPDAARRLRQQFDERFHPQAAELRPLALSLLETWRTQLPAEIFFEELLHLDQALIAQLGWAKYYTRALDFFRWLRQNPDYLAPGRTSAKWFHRLKSRLSETTWEESPVAEDLAHLWDLARQDDPDAEPPAFLKTVAFPSAQSLPERDAVIYEDGDGLAIEFDESKTPERRVVARIASRNALLTTHTPFWKQEPGPKFAKRYGRDQYGPWFEFEVERDGKPPVVQRMRWIPPGSFLMGSPETEEGRIGDEAQHHVTLSEGFWVFDTPCAQDLWTTVMGKNLSTHMGHRRPIECVSWNDAQSFLGALMDRIGLALSLPTEAQWEFACRAGTTTRYHFGDAIAPADACYGRTTQRGTTNVASFPPNNWGLFDMHGNVREWCSDEMSLPRFRFDPTSRTREVGERVIRGGGWGSRPWEVRSAYREADHPDVHFDGLGFRCVWSHSPAEPVEIPTSDVVGVVPIGGTARELDLPAASHLVVRSDCEQLELESTNKPPWASAFGRDRYGLWADLMLQNETEKRRWSRKLTTRFRISTRVPVREVTSVTQRLRWIPPGRMIMGSPTDEEGRLDREGPQHEVTISRGFWIFETPCTQRLWLAVMAGNPSRFADPMRPVEMVDWNQATQFSERLSELVTGLSVQLPTEAQWEYACRAGTQTAIYSGALKILGNANAPDLDLIAWYGGNSGVEYELDEGDTLRYLDNKRYEFEKAGTHPVKLKKPNPWGLYDMLGNVWEWCRDGLRDYSGECLTDPVGQARSDEDRVARGGGWLDDAQRVRVASRYGNHPVARDDVQGFRCVCTQSPSAE